ncbi:hypothetical protein O3P69_020666 [Scylla paramamosain]|uniref:Uncharacterized protein n=1 Tax=Scylla paramamosain TaxID=85552 RepID=A0AAW0TNE3_SCYPA
MSQEECVSTTVDNRLMAVDAAKPSQICEPSRTCNRRYSEVMREYLRRKRQRDGNIDDTNIKPSEVLTRQADHTGPSGCSYVRWDNPDTPGLLSVNTQVPVVEESCEVCDVQEEYCSPRLSPFSPLTPESGADSFSTAKSHFSSNPPTSLLPRTNVSPDSSSPDLAEGYFLPRDNVTSVGIDSFRSRDSHTPGGLKAPVINVYSAGGSPKMRHNEDECGQSESRCLAVQPCQSASRTYVLNTFKEERPFGEERQCYPPEEKESSSYSLRHTSLQPWGNEGSPTFTWPPSEQQGSGRPVSQASVTARLQKLKRLHRLGWSLIVLGVIIIFLAVLIYFILE